MLARFPAAHAIALALVLLPAPAPAAGTTETGTTTTGTTRSKAVSSKRRAPATLAPAATPVQPATPAPAYAPLPPQPVVTTYPVVQPSSPGFRVSALVGAASPQGNGGDASVVLHVEGSSALYTTAAGVTFSLALPVRGVKLSSTAIAGIQAGGYGLEGTPTLRASLPLGRSKLSLRSDLGVGVVHRWTWTQTDVTYLGRITEVSQDTTGILRLGISFEWALRPGVSLVAEPLTFGWDLDGNADWIFAGGLSYRL